MKDLFAGTLRGSVRTLSTERAEWDLALGSWQAARVVSTVTFHRDGQASDGESYDADGSTYRWSRGCDETGRILEEQSWKDEGPRTTVTHAYDFGGRLTSSVEVTPDGSRRPRDTYEYDHAGRKTKTTVLECEHAGRPIDGYGVEGSETVYGVPDAARLTTEYDERGLSVEATFKNSNDEVVRRVVFSRDAAGRVLNEAVYFEGSSPFLQLPVGADASAEDRAQIAALLGATFPGQLFAQRTYAYDDKGRVTERTSRMGSLGGERETLEYDERDNLILQTSEHERRVMGLEAGVPSVRDEGAVPVQHTQFDYQYDGRGNWTERVVSTRLGSEGEFQRSNVERRAITYYDE